MSLKKFLKDFTVQGENGQIGLLFTFIILSILSVMGISFLYRMRLEQMAASNFKDGIKADYIAQAGLERAIAELRNDANEYDDLYEGWAQTIKETIKDEDSLEDEDVEKFSELQHETRYAEIEVEIFDEASKININTAGSFFGQGWIPYEINLCALEGLSKNQAEAILRYRYGKDGAPGKRGVDDDGDNVILQCDGIDNDADGEIDEENEGVDEPDEFCPDHPYGDDHPFDTVEEIRLVPGIGEETFNEIKDFITIYSYDKELDKERKPRININKASPSAISLALQRIGYPEDVANQIAVNIVDFRDEDRCPTEYQGSYGIEKTPYINEVMPHFTCSVETALEDAIEVGTKFLLDKAEKALTDRLNEKIKKDASFAIDKAKEEVLKKERSLVKKIEKIIKNYKIENLKRKSFLDIFRGKRAWAQEKEKLEIDVEMEWIELFNPYETSCSISGWQIESSCGKRKLWGKIAARSYKLLFNVVIKIGEDVTGKELLGNYTDTVILRDDQGNVVDKVTYSNHNLPWNAFEKNDPRAREFVSSLPGGSPGFRNWSWLPTVGEGKDEDDYSSFYVKDKPFVNIGEIGYIHTGKQWRTIRLQAGGDWKICDKITVFDDRITRGKININTASEQVLESLPYIDSSLARAIIMYNEKKGPFKEIGEIAELFLLEKLGYNGIDDDEDGYIDEEDEKEIIFRFLSNLITVRSNCFLIVSEGRLIREGQVVAERKIKAVLDRGAFPLKIRYYRQIY
ncbi:hypothetical protein DRJ00_03390 [Candidatus Aerophobetes bacterium]|uniref:Uncharacterized protein n=1 Tax=Aerophobetes bacterium TaxID=2030807 RepID=A0A497E5B3_UNCAE|nr:MAG: hypothetical protein DRJ00_03390 [Candidatus Aerophobetes bacterium]